MSNWGYDELLETMEATCWCVEHNNRWVSLSADGGIICTEDSPTGEGKAMCIEWFAAQNLLEYKDLITSVDHSCNNLDANWPVTLVQTAEAIDVLSKILTNFMGKEHEVKESRQTKEWTRGVLAEGSKAIHGWRDGTVFTYQHDCGELAIGVGTFWSTEIKTHRQQLQLDSGATNPDYLDEFVSGFYACYGENISSSLEENHNCGWEEFLKDLSKVFEAQPPRVSFHILKVSRDLLQNHKAEFLKKFNSAANYEEKIWRLGCEKEAKHWKSALTQKITAWISKESDYEAQVACLQNENAKLHILKDSKERQCKVKIQEGEIRRLRKQLSEYRVNSGSASSGLTSINIASQTNFPSVNEVLKRYDKVADNLMDNYDDAVYDKDSGKPVKELQLEFAENLVAILKGIWEAICPLYIQVVKDQCGCSDLTVLSDASIQKCDEHCRQNWKTMFMPIFARIFKAHGVESRAEHVLQVEEAPTSSKDTYETAAIPEHAMEWFFKNIKKDLLERLCEIIILLFLQRPVLRLLLEEGVAVISFDSNKYFAHDIELQEGQKVVALLPPICCAPDNVPGANLGFGKCHSANRTILRKGTADQLGTEESVGTI